MQQAYFAGGCFWCIASVFAALPGVKKVTDGYAGGDTPNPTYQQVKSQQTTHRETICITYDEAVVSYKQLVDVFFDNVDPFDAEGQFIDKGFSYTLALFYRTEAERQIGQAKVATVQQAFGREVFVSVLPYKNFFLAEPEHQDYAQNNPEAFAEEYALSGRKDYFNKKK